MVCANTAKPVGVDTKDTAPFASKPTAVSAENVELGKSFVRPEGLAHVVSLQKSLLLSIDTAQILYTRRGIVI